MDNGTHALETHPLDEAVRLTGEGGTYQGKTTEAYANMVGPFGGVLAAVLLQAVMKQDKSMGEPISLTVNFLAPISDGPFEITTSCIRTNRSNQHWYMALHQNGDVAANATVVLAKRRDTWGTTDMTMPEAPGVDTLERIRNDFFPAWVNRYDIRPFRGTLPPLIVIEGEEPFKGSETIQWVRDDAPRPIDFISLTALCDTFFPRVFMRRAEFIPAGTVSMTIYFHADTATCEKVGKAHVLGHSRAQRFHNTYSDQSAELWAADGTLLATTHQVVYYKE